MLDLLLLTQVWIKRPRLLIVVVASTDSRRRNTHLRNLVPPVQHVGTLTPASRRAAHSTGKITMQYNTIRIHVESRRNCPVSLTPKQTQAASTII